MEEDVRLELFTVQQVREWLKTGVGERGLSDLIIPRTRAWAIVNGPYAQEDDPVVVAIFVGDNIAAHVATFPELINGERYWCFPDLWCAPEYRGKGYSLIVMGTIAEMFGVEHCIDKWCAPEAIQVFEYLGLKIKYLPRYVLGTRVNRSSNKGKIVSFIRILQKKLHRLVECPIKEEEYSLRYLSYIDDETYAFISSWGKDDYILHTQEYLNWVLTYQFTNSAPLLNRVQNILSFAPAETYNRQMYAVQVLSDGKIIGVYVMKQKESGLHILYLYYNEMLKDKVFASIRDHVRKMQSEQCYTENKDLYEYLNAQIYFPKRNVEKVSYVYPSSMQEPQLEHVQYGDGDCFTV